ncbi:MAG: sulfatase-like hydrolase/transferase, partial [Candidatus Aminicenantes bacterium]|nr:sulfatase-like hydrolase/transferase [Candidatus Aminicenantes bacterium]
KPFFKKVFGRRRHDGVMRKTAKIIFTSTFLAFVCGIVIHFAQLKLTLSHISANKYFYHKMYRLIALNLKDPLLDLITAILLIDLIFLCLYLLWKFFISPAVKIKIDFRIINKKRLKIYFACLVCTFFLVLVYGQWIMKSRTFAGFNLGAVLLNIAVLLFTCFLAWALIKTNWENLFKAVKIKHFTRAAFFMILLFSILSALILFSASTKKEPPGPNIILITIDCLRADHLGCYGYGRKTSPHIDGLAAAGVLFKKAYTNAPWTKPAVASIFTSLYPNRHSALNHDDALPQEALTIAEILKNSGYRTCFFHGGNPYISSKFNFDQGFETIVGISRAEELTGEFLSSLDESIKDEKFFAYIHYMDLHLPYHKNRFNKQFLKKGETSLLKPGFIFVESVRSLTAEGNFPDSDRYYLEALYDGQLRFVDAAIKEIITFLENRKKLKNTVVIITSDHGEEFWEHGSFEHGHTVYNELLHVPLIIFGKPFSPKKIETPVNLIDLLPGILDTAGVSSARPGPQGRSLLDGNKKFFGGPGGEFSKKPPGRRRQGINNPGDRSIFVTGTLYGDEKFALIKNGLKIIFNSGKKKGKNTLTGYKPGEKYEIYDLNKDPFEKFNLLNEIPGSRFLELKKELERFIATAGALKGEKITPEKEKEIEEKLKSLGYL